MTQHISSLFTPIERPAIAVRSAKEDIISQIVERTTADKKLLAKRIALWANRYRLTETDLHALLAKATDPTIRKNKARYGYKPGDSIPPKPEPPKSKRL